MPREIPQACGQCECCAAWRTAAETKREAVVGQPAPTESTGPYTDEYAVETLTGLARTLPEVDEQHSCLRGALAIKAIAARAQGVGRAVYLGPSAATRDCADDVCQAAKDDGILCADGGCDYHSGIRKPPEGAPTPTPDSAEWWRQVAQGLGVEVARMKRLAKEATNGWACHATRKREHDEIARLHREIDAHVAEFGEGDDIRARAAQREVLEEVRKVCHGEEWFTIGMDDWLKRRIVQLGESQP